MVVTDSGVENVNKDVNALQEKGIIKRILALVEVDYSNSKTEAFLAFSQTRVIILKLSRQRGRPAAPGYILRAATQRSGPS